MKQTRPLALSGGEVVLEFLHIIVKLTEILTLKIVVPTMKYERIDKETKNKNEKRHSLYANKTVWYLKK